MWSSFTSLRDILTNHLKDKGLHSKLETTLILEEYTKIAAKIWDKEIAAEMKALYLKNKILTVAVLNSILAQEINMRRELILSELKRKFGSTKVTDIRVIF